VNRNPSALPDDELTRVKKLTLVAMVADDELLELLVLKGGNAMDLIHGVSGRSSIDLDFSTATDIDKASVLSKVQRSLESTFAEAGYVAFDIKMAERPGTMPEELAAFWGGYCVEFKLIQADRATALSFDVEQMRRQAIIFGEGAKFTIDISRYEYVADKQQAILDGYTLYVYSPEMIVCEKLRAICQQLADYGAIVQRASVGGKSRARDFVDIDTLLTKYEIDLTSEHTRHIIREMFGIKKVPLSYLGRVAEMRALHAAEFDTVQEAMRPGTKLEAFDYYFDKVLASCQLLEPLWHE
jgi:predicted nucleotidyltransferase component of viral defense system